MKRTIPVMRTTRRLTPIACVTIFSLLLSASCVHVRKRQPVSSVYSSKELSVTPNQMRLRMRSLIEPFAGEIEQSADAITAGTSDISVKRAAIRWKIEGVPALRSALFQPNPFTAVLDTWVLTYQMATYFENGPGRAEFGPGATHAVDTCFRIEKELNQVVSTFTVSGDVTKVREGAKKWAMDHPIRYSIRDRETTLSRVTETDIGVEWTSGEIIAELATTADDVHREIQIYSDHLFRQARWEAELLKLDFPTSEVMPLAVRAVKSSERAVDTLDGLAPTIKTTAAAATDAAKFTSAIPTLVASERKAAVDAINEDLRTTLRFIDDERVASLEQISRERIAIVQKLDDERRAATEDLREIATNERVDLTRDIEQAGLRVVDHAAWRVLQIAAIMLGSSCLVGVIFLFMVRRLFFFVAPASPVDRAKAASVSQR